MRPAARPNEARKKLFLNHLEKTFLCIPDHLRPTLFLPLIKFIFFKFFLSPENKMPGLFLDLGHSVILCDFFRMM